MNDYEGEEIEPAGEIATRMYRLVQALRKAQDDQARLELELKVAEAEVRRLAETAIPEVMAELGTDIYRLPQDGTVIQISPEVKANITNENKEVAYNWLDENGHGGLVKRTIVVAFNRDQEEAARKLREQLSKEYAGVKQDVSIHAQTLSAWARRRLEAGEEVPECISVHKALVAKLKAKKEV